MSQTVNVRGPLELLDPADPDDDELLPHAAIPAARVTAHAATEYRRFTDGLLLCSLRSNRSRSPAGGLDQQSGIDHPTLSSDFLLVFALAVRGLSGHNGLDQ
jgi:hypothetical protein